MKHYSYQTKIQPSQDQLLISNIDAWTQYAENKSKNESRSSNMVLWHCFCCNKQIKVHYKTKSFSSLYCKNCKPKYTKRNGVLLRYMLMFNNHVRALFIKNTNINKILK